MGAFVSKFIKNFIVVISMARFVYVQFGPIPKEDILLSCLKMFEKDFRKNEKMYINKLNIISKE
eukprot:snap_masked-scaffold_13-processed-gene-6.30-mRNA-1 protein AED:1.00 eAED:1.00 QI:0/-1/0/0/-1/1/1/0/63